MKLSLAILAVLIAMAGPAHAVYENVTPPHYPEPISESHPTWLKTHKWVDWEQKRIKVYIELFVDHDENLWDYKWIGLVYTIMEDELRKYMKKHEFCEYAGWMFTFSVSYKNKNYLRVSDEIVDWKCASRRWKKSP